MYFKITVEMLTEYSYDKQSINTIKQYGLRKQFEFSIFFPVICSWSTKYKKKKKNISLRFSSNSEVCFIIPWKWIINFLDISNCVSLSNLHKSHSIMSIYLFQYVRNRSIIGPSSVIYCKLFILWCPGIC